MLQREILDKRAREAFLLVADAWTNRQIVSDELLPANPAGPVSAERRRSRAVIDPFTRDEAAHVVAVARQRFPEWYPWLLCRLRTGMRAGELLALQWGDFNWQRRFVQVQRNLVRGVLTTPKNHQRRRVDLSHQLTAALRLWRRQQRAVWLAAGRPFPDWVFSSVTGTALDESNVRKALNRILDGAGVHRRGPHQMRHTFASLLLQEGAPITYVSQQLRHRDPSITLRVYAHWLPDASTATLVNRLDDAVSDGTQTAPATLDDEVQRAVSGLNSVVTQIFASWNQTVGWLRCVNSFRHIA